MLTFLAWLLLFVLCWPLALLALVLYPGRVGSVLLPFRLAWIAVQGALELEVLRQVAATGPSRCAPSASR